MKMIVEIDKPKGDYPVQVVQIGADKEALQSLIDDLAQTSQAEDGRSHSPLF